MRRTLAILIFAILAIVAFVPLLVGPSVQREIEAAQAPLGSSLGIPLELESYERGWFRARAVACTIVPLAGWGTEPACVDYHIQHGPLLLAEPAGIGWFGIRMTPRLPSAAADALRNVAGDATPVVVTMRAGLSGRTRIVAESAAARGALGDATIDAAEARWEASYHPTTRQLEGLIDAPHLQIEGPLLRFDLRRLEGEIVAEEAAGGWWLGTATASLEKFLVASDTVDDIQVRGARVGYRAALVGDERIDLAWTLDVDQLLSAATSSGAAGGLSLALSNVRAVPVDTLPQPWAPGSSVDVRTSILALRGTLEPLLRDGGVVDLERLQLRLGEDSLEGHLRIDVGPPGDEPSLQALAQRVSADGELLISRTLAERALGRTAVEQWLGTGLATARDSALYVGIDLADGKLAVGEKEFPLVLLLAMLSLAK